MQLTSEQISATAALLERAFESVRAVVDGEDNRIKRGLEALKQLALRESIPIAIVGGLGTIYYGYRTTTDDIDISVGKADLDRLLDVAARNGLKVLWRAKTGWHTLAYDDVEINVVPEGGRARTTSPTTLPGPAQLGVSSGFGYASYEGWLELKLSSGRLKDLGHVAETLKVATPEMIAKARDHLAKVDPTYVARFEEVLQQVMSEKEDERERKPPEQ
jgi:hypothetical protein